MITQYTLPNTTAKIELENLLQPLGESNNHYQCTYRVVDSNGDVINSQEFAVTSYYIPAEETDKGLYIARHFQGYIYDGAVWIAAIVASEE